MARFNSLTSYSWNLPKTPVPGTNQMGVYTSNSFDILGSTANVLTHNLNKVVCGVYIVNETDDNNYSFPVEYDPEVATNSLIIYNDNPANLKATVFVYYLI